MDIILNTRFNNPNLPVTPLPGFYDDFTSGSPIKLDHTSREERPYIFNGEAWPIVDGYVTPGGRAAAVDGYSNDGVLSTRYVVLGSATRVGLVARYTGESYLWIAPNTSGNLAIYETISGSNNLIMNSTTKVLDGDTLQVFLQGPLVQARLNGGLVDQAQTTLTTGTTHGFFSWSATSEARFEYLSFEV